MTTQTAPALNEITRDALRLLEQSTIALHAGRGAWTKPLAIALHMALRDALEGSISLHDLDAVARACANVAVLDSTSPAQHLITLARATHNEVALATTRVRLV